MELNPGVSAEVLLGNYLQGFLWVDEDWLEVEASAATYWQARLAQTTTVEVLPDGKTKWRIRTRIVEKIPDGASAEELCLSLNRYAAGWSFIFSDVERTVDAIAAICAPPQWDTFFLRLSEKAKLSAWMSDVFAERLADAVGGVPAFSHPRGQSGLRVNFDATYHYLETIRGRPEWILDLTRYQFPPVEDVASAIAEMVGSPHDQISCDLNELRIPLGRFSDRDVTLHAGFGKHVVVGDGWQSSLKLPGQQISESLAGQLTAMTWQLFNDPQSNLLGAWTHDANQLVFQQWDTMSEVRNQEQLGSYGGRSAGDLWGFTSTLSDVLGALSQIVLTADSGATGDGAESGRAERVVAAIAEQARPAVGERYEVGQEPADRSLLWLEHRRTIAVAAWFNPMGPTVSSIEVCALPDGAEYLVQYRRHPFAPFHCVLGVVEPGTEFLEIPQEASDLLFGGGSLPNVLVLWSAPDATAAEVPGMLRDRVIEVAEQSGDDLNSEAAWIAETMGSPWEFAAVDQSAASRVRTVAEVDSKAKPALDHGFAKWWQQVSSFGNLTANFRYLPDAWDGALNTQQAHGGLRHFDVGPLMLTYSKIGMPGPEPDPQPSSN